MANGTRAYDPEELDISFPGAQISGSTVALPSCTCSVNSGASDSSWTSASVRCSTKDGVSYRRFYGDTTPPLCLALKTDSFANQVCKTMSDREPFSWDGGTNYYYIR